MTDDAGGERLAALMDEVGLVRAAIARLEHDVERVTYDATRLAPSQLALVSDIEGLKGRLDAVEPALRRLEAAQRTSTLVSDIWTTTAWIAGEDVAATRISVIIATRNRSSLLRQAIASILNQEYATWELIVIDDGSEDDTPGVLAGLADDPRVVTIRTEGAGVAAARNRGLARAGGDVITYLDDDNRMHPRWLRSVVWAFARWPETDVLYGARIIDDHSRALGGPTGGAPWLILHPYSRGDLERFNVADTNVIAHRAGLAEARFDEELAEWADWDLLLRLTKEKPPAVLPVLACFYTTDAQNRLSGGSADEVDRIRKKLDLPTPQA